jgi:lipoprotein Spr
MLPVVKLEKARSAFFLFFLFLSVAVCAQTNQPSFASASTTDIVKKYSLLLSIDEKEVARFKPLYSFIDKWLGTPYAWGGCSTSGIDCSCFVQLLFEDVYKIKLKRTSFTQFYDNDVSLFKNPKQYATGDLIFFKTAINRQTRRNRITHVGIYLTNGFFVQSSSSGVNIASLKNSYWRNCMVAAGRLKESFYAKAGMKVTPFQMEEDKTKYIAEEDSYFEPPVLAERYDSIIKKYSLLLGVQGESLQLPELFSFLDSVKKSGYYSTCLEPATASDCMISDLYKNVFDVPVDARALATRAAGSLEILKPDNQPAIGDIVYFKSGAKPSQAYQTALYLHNGFVAYNDQMNVTITQLVKPGVQRPKGLIYARFPSPLLEMAAKNLSVKRRAEDSLARLVASGLMEAAPRTTNVAIDPGKSLPLKLSSQTLAELVPPMAVPYEETANGSYVGLVLRYAKELNVHPMYLNTPLLYSFVDRWRGRGYKKGACNEKRLDGECFLTNYFSEVHDRRINIKNTTDLYGTYLTPLDGKGPLQEGDVLYFGRRVGENLEVSFTGIYLYGNYFLSPSPYTKKVSLCRVDDPLYTGLFLAAGRPR